MSKRKFFIIWMLLVSVACISAFVLVHQNPHQKKQEALAVELGVEINNYPNPISFPVGYYYQILHPNMKIDEVHEAIRGFEHVLHCGRYSEIYYYFYKEDNRALRFEVFYNENGGFEQIRGEDSDSRTIRIDGCHPGYISE